MILWDICRLSSVQVSSTSLSLGLPEQRFLYCVTLLTIKKEGLTDSAGRYKDKVG
jgi:hypothetical protein